MAYLRSVHMPFLFQLQFTGFSFFWMLISLLLGLAYAFLLYRNKSELPPAVKKIVFVSRTLSVAFIAFLLFAPFIKLTDRAIEKPLIIVLQDNSASVNISKPAGFDIGRYQQELKDVLSEFSDGYELRTFTFANSVKEGLTFGFNEKTTDLAAALKAVNNKYANRNIGAVIVASDGIYNRGGNPLYEARNLKAPIYTIALGDTIPKKDLLISNVNYNNLVYLGNDFQIAISMEAYQAKGLSSRLSVSGKGGTFFSKILPVNSNEYRTTIPVTLSAREKGIHKFTVSVSPVSGELSTQNNTYTFFVEVLDGRQQVYILAHSPHPDVTAIKQSIEGNKNYEVKTGFATAFNREELERANLLILHQLPSVSLGEGALRALTDRKSLFFVIGAQTSIPAFSASQGILSVISQGVMQEAVANVNQQFYDFVLSDHTKSSIENFAPLQVPFGNFAIKGQASVLLNQKSGRINTDKPLLVFGTLNGQKAGILAGEGLWRWRLEDFNENGNHQAVDELLGKTIQYLSSKDDKRKFRAYTTKNSFDESEQVVINAELYNDAYELVNTPDVAVTIKHASGKSFPFMFSRNQSSYILNAGILPVGEYSYTASTRLGDKSHSSSGRFVISQQQIEYQQTIANHQLLYALSQESSGELVYPAHIGRLPQLIKANELVKTISFENRRYEELVNLKVLFFLILALLTLEWFNRKRNGSL